MHIMPRCNPSKFKTVPCKNCVRRGDNWQCPYSSNCKFIHPCDPEPATLTTWPHWFPPQITTKSKVCNPAVDVLLAGLERAEAELVALVSD